VRTRRYEATDCQRGFTLVELMVTMLIGSVLLAIGSAAVFNLRNTSEQSGSATQMLSQFRKVAELSQSEGRTYCIDLAANRTYKTWRYACSGPTAVSFESARTTQSARVTFSSTGASTANCPAGDRCVYFYPRGTATAATITIISSARGKVYTLHVEGLTSRVYL
jgi:prepilin-type N-terminal cleavage/methylation domain-containing protein